MESKSNISATKDAQSSTVQEALGQSKWSKFENWCKTKAFPWLANVANRIGTAIGNMHIPVLNWYAVLVLVVLAYMAQNGVMDDMPNIKWLVESTVRLTEWIFSLFRTIIEWCIGVLESKLSSSFDIFGIVELFTNWVKEIFAL